MFLLIVLDFCHFSEGFWTQFRFLNRLNKDKMAKNFLNWRNFLYFKFTVKMRYNYQPNASINLNPKKAMHLISHKIFYTVLVSMYKKLF